MNSFRTLQEILSYKEKRRKNEEKVKLLSCDNCSIRNISINRKIIDYMENKKEFYAGTDISDCSLKVLSLVLTKHKINLEKMMGIFEDFYEGEEYHEHEGYVYCENEEGEECEAWDIIGPESISFCPCGYWDYCTKEFMKALDELTKKSSKFELEF